MCQPLGSGAKVKPEKTRQKAHWAKRAACIGSRAWQVIGFISMLQVTDEGVHTKEETTTQIITSTGVKHLFAIPIPLWFLAQPTSFKRPDEHAIKSVQSVVVWVCANKMLENQKHHQIPQDSWPTNQQRRNREYVNQLSPAFAQPSHWSPISMNLQRDAMVLKASPVSHRVGLKVWAATHGTPKFLTRCSTAIYDLIPHHWVVLINGSKQRVWQQHRHTVHKFAQCGVPHRKQDPLELGQIWLWQQALEISPAVV